MLLSVKITLQKNAATIFIKWNSDGQDLGLSNKLLRIIIVQGVANLWPVEVSSQISWTLVIQMQP